MEPTAERPPGLPKADPLARLAARFVDGLLLAALGAALRLAAGLGPFDRGRLGFAITVVLDAAYEAGFTSRRGRTPGKALVRLAVLDAATGRPPSPGRALARWAVVSVPVWAPLPGPAAWLELVAVVALVVVPAFSRPDGRGLHDRLARTQVVPGRWARTHGLAGRA